MKWRLLGFGLLPLDLPRTPPRRRRGDGVPPAACPACPPPTRGWEMRKPDRRGLPRPLIRPIGMAGSVGEDVVLAVTFARPGYGAGALAPSQHPVEVSR